MDRKIVSVDGESYQTRDAHASLLARTTESSQTSGEAVFSRVDGRTDWFRTQTSSHRPVVRRTSIGSRNTKRCADRCGKSDAVRDRSLDGHDAPDCGRTPNTPPITILTAVVHVSFRSSAVQICFGILRYLRPPSTPNVISTSLTGTSASCCRFRRRRRRPARPCVTRRQTSTTAAQKLNKWRKPNGRRRKPRQNITQHKTTCTYTIIIYIIIIITVLHLEKKLVHVLRAEIFNPS